MSCPQRTIDADRLPPIDILVVSHRHPDHFDLASLARVDRRADAICTADPLIVYALEQLGFEAVHPVHPMAPIVGDGFELFPTRSELRSIPRWAACSTIGQEPSGIRSTRPWLPRRSTGSGSGSRASNCPFAMYGSQNLEFFESLTTRFPTETHQ